LQLVADGSAHIVVPNRGVAGMASLPKIQRLLEEAGNEYWDRFFGFQADKPLFDLSDGALDLWVGVRIISPIALKYFLEYDGRHGDKWMSIFAPLALAAAAGMIVTGRHVDSLYKYEQSKWEAKNNKKASKSLGQAVELWAGAETLSAEIEADAA
ncbi:MAG TPA: hypothetical protein VI322_00780, partial [Candidatus Saccharimonadia bacterium]